MIVFILVSFPLSVRALAAAQPGQEHSEGQIKSIEERLEDAQRELNDERYEGALAAAKEALRIAEQMPDTLVKALYGRAVARTLMGMAYARAGDHAQAVEAWRKANEIYDRLTTTEANHALTLENMGNSLEILGQPQQAIDAYWAAAFLAEKTGKLEEAVRPELRALAVLGQQPITAASLSKIASGNYNAGLWEQQLGKFDEAAASFLTSLTYLNKLAGSPEIGKVRGFTLEQLGACLTKMGRYSQWVKAGDALDELKMYSLAAEFFEKGLALYEAELPNGPERAAFHQKIAFELSLAEGWWKAHEHLRTKLEILKKSKNTEEEQAATLRDDGLALANDSQYDQAYEAFRSALTLYASVPDSHVQTAELLSRAGSALHRMKQKSQALQVFKAALPYYDQTKKNPRYDGYNHAATLGEIGILLVEENQGVEAIPYFRKALAVSENLQKDATVMQAKIRWSLGVELEAAGKVEEAIPYISESYFAYNRAQLQRLPQMNEADRHDFLDWVDWRARYLYRLAMQHPTPWLPLGVQAVVTTKSLADEVSEAESRVWLEAFQTSNPEELTQLHELRSAVARLVLLQVSDYVTQADPNREQLNRRATELKVLEASLRKKAAAEWPARALTIPRAADIRAVLREGDAILEYVTYSPERAVNSETKGEEHYGVFVLTPQEGRTFAIDLGPASVIDSVILEYRLLYEAQIDPRKFRLDEDALAAQAHKIKSLLVNPVLNALAKPEAASSKPRRLYVVSAGTISLVAFEALPQGHQGSAWQYLLEDCEFVYLKSSRDLVASRQHPQSKSIEVWLVGNPDFNARPSSGGAPTSSSAEKRYEDSIPNSWMGLNGTGELLKLIEQRSRKVKLNPKVLSGPNASETALRGLHSPKFLLVATHGHFMSNVAPVASLNLVSRGQKSDWGADFTASMDPRMRSMLVLAGANRRYRPLEPEKPVAESATGATGTQRIARFDTDDGLLTAFEARDIDLRDTDVAVLVGCESSLGIVPRQEYRNTSMTMSTGMGMQVEGGSLGNMVWTLPQLGDEAVTGLPLAFFVAGASSVISSTSTIPVSQNAQLVDDFLEAWLNRNHGSNRYASFHSAQLSALARARQKGNTHPFEWAGLIYIGQPDDAPHTP